MAYLTVTGIVTRYVNYKDNDRILTLFTREMGRIDARARGCRRQKSPLLACSQPFVFGEFQIFAGKERYTIDQCDVRETFYSLREDMDRFLVGSAMLALSQHAVQESEPNPELFSLLYHGLSFLCYGEGAPIDIGLCFTTRYIRTAGFCPGYYKLCRLRRGFTHNAHAMLRLWSGAACCVTTAQNGPGSSVTCHA